MYHMKTPSDNGSNQDGKISNSAQKKKDKFLRILLLVLIIFIGAGERSAQAETIQFLGDYYSPKHVLVKRRENNKKINVFSGLSEILLNTTYNVANFEGTVTSWLKSQHLGKTYLLNMPPSAISQLPSAHINAVTLANNHSMDFGSQGLFDTLASLRNLRIKTAGVGYNINEALKPMVLGTKYGNVCILAFSRTLPTEFWAGPNKAGTANLNFTKTADHIKKTSTQCLVTFVSYHWGAEQENKAKAYQYKLAKLSIDAGADAVIGHHPHVLQEIEIYKNKPILYSLGNFVFGTRPRHSKQEGMAAKFHIGEKGITAMELTPLSVNNNSVNFVPTLFAKKEKADHFDPPRHCKLVAAVSYQKYHCTL